MLLLAIAAVGYGVMRAAAEWRAPLTTGARIDLSLARLPYYAGLSTLRMTIAYAASLAFSLVYARVAAGSRIAERFMLPLLDILQSIPILSFMPGVVLGLAALFPRRSGSSWRRSSSSLPARPGISRSASISHSSPFRAN